MDTVIEIHPCHQEDLISKTKNFIAFWRDLSSKSVLSMSPGNAIKRNDKENFNAFVRSLYKKCKDKHLLASTIESEGIIYLDNVINSENDTDDHIEKELDSLIKRLEEKLHHWVVIFPIDHLNLSNLDKIDLKSSELVPFSQIEKEFGNVMNKKDSHWENAIKRNVSNKVCLKVEVTAEEQNQYDEARIEYENVINVFRIYLYYYGNGELVKIGLGENIFSQYMLLSFSKDDIGRWGISGINKRFKDAEFTLTPDIIKELEEKYYFNEIRNILGEKNRSKLQTQVLLAIRWIGSGIHEDVESDKIIKFTTALECLLIPGTNQSNKSKSESLAERCAFLLEDIPSERYEIYCKIKDLYNIRSNIVHDGDQTIDSKSVFMLKDYAVRCLFKVIAISASNKNMCEIKQIVDWVDNKKMMSYYGTNKHECRQGKAT